MSAFGWFERLLNSVADHGVDLVGLKERGGRVPSDSELCHRLVDGLGEASNIALAREILQRWQTMDEGRRLNFLNMIAAELDPDPLEIMQAARNYQARDPDSLRQLLEVSEPPRQELFRRLNMAPGGTAVLVAMREFLLRQVSAYPGLRGVEADMHHLLISWFNRGFLRLERIDWNSPASILEKLIRYEAVHPMQGWDDLRRRLGPDRRCFAFFHPALPRDPLIFVEVALTQGMADSITPLIDPERPFDDPLEADTAVFYSINNALKGLRGVSFGNFLIKQVVNELSDEFPLIQNFVTLSPLPMFRSTLRRLMQEDLGGVTRAELFTFLGARTDRLSMAGGVNDPLQALDELMQQKSPYAPLTKLTTEVLNDLALFYLTVLRRGEAAYEPVAHFHLSNGARLERINVGANPGARGQEESWTCMVNFRYEPAELVANHEAYVCTGTLALSNALGRQREHIAAQFKKDTSA